MYYFLDKNATVDEIKFSKNNKMFITYIDEYDVFIDSENRKVDITNKRVMPITSKENLIKHIELIEKHCGIPSNSKKEIEAIENWFQYIEPKRYMSSFKIRNLNPAQECVLIENLGLNKTIWFRNITSGFEKEITLNDLLNPNSALRKTMNIYYEDTYIVEEFINIEKNNFGKKQYRCFVLNGRVINISRIMNNNYHKVEQIVIKEAINIVKNLPTSFPNTFVLDLAIANEEVDVLNVEPFESAERYLYNSIFPEIEDLEHIETYRLPQEKRTKGFEYQIEKEIEQEPEDYFAKTYQEYLKCMNSQEIGFSFKLKKD